MHSFDRILLSAFEFDVHAVIKESRYTISLHIRAIYARKNKRRTFRINGTFRQK